MPTTTYTPLANITLTGATSSITFTSITAGFRDYVIIGTFQNVSSPYIALRFNSDTGGNYNRVEMFGDGTSTGAQAQSNETLGYSAGNPMANNSMITMSILDASATDKHKTWLSRYSGASNVVSAQANRWANTSAITSITVLTGSGTWGSGTTFALYGIAS